MALILDTAPTALPITLAEAKFQCRVDTSDEDAHIETLIAAVTSHLDGWQGTLGRCLMPQTWDLYYDAFPCGPLKLPLVPLIAVEFVKYTNSSGVVVTFDPGNYEVDLVSSDGWIVPGDAGWPTDVMDKINAVWARFRAGYSDGVPEALRHAIKVMVADLYEHRESVVIGQPVTESPLVKYFLGPFRRVGF